VRSTSVGRVGPLRRDPRLVLADAQRQGRLDSELDRLQRIPLLIVDEVVYIRFDPQAAKLMFMLVSRRYERASMIVTSNKPFSGWGEIFGDEVTAAAMIDGLVHHAEILALKSRASSNPARLTGAGLIRGSAPVAAREV
jgi:DNA replication protein DnaC